MKYSIVILVVWSLVALAEEAEMNTPVAKMEIAPPQVADVVEKDAREELKAYLEEGEVYVKNGDLERATAAFNSAIVIDPDNALARRGLKTIEVLEGARQ